MRNRRNACFPEPRKNGLGCNIEFVDHNTKRLGMPLIPSSRGLQRRGGFASRKCCEATFASADGVVKNMSDHPVRSYIRMPSAIFFEVASSPPLEEGISSILIKRGREMMNYENSEKWARAQDEVDPLREFRS